MLVYVPLINNGELECIEQHKPFKCVVLISEAVSDSWQKTVSTWLVASECLYMMAWGDNCSSWDDSVNVANIEAFDFDKIPEDEFVMTTWHEGEPLEDVFHYAKYSANHGAVELQNLIVLDIGKSGRETQLRALFDKV